MNKLHIKTPSIKVTKRVALITLGSLIVLALFTVAVIGQVKHEREQKAQEAAHAAKLHDAEVASNNKIQALQSQLKVSESKRKQVCDYTVALSKAPATRGRVTTPALACQ